MMAGRNYDPDPGPLALFGDELRYLRKAAGLSLQQLADLISYSVSLVSAVENCSRTPSPDFAERCDTALDTGGALVRLLRRLKKYADRLAFPAWFREWPPIEERAVLLRSWELAVIPGLLQTEDYARAVMRGTLPDATDEEIEAKVRARMTRQEILAKDDPPLLRAIMAEAALRLPVGGAKVMREALAHLAEMAGRPGIRILVVPASAGPHVGLLGAFCIATIDGDDADAEIVYLETVVQGQITDRPEVVTACAAKFDSLLAEALSPKASLELITEVMESWI
jgi:transcriptional regulator with XRE-family HTH domain